MAKLLASITKELLLLRRDRAGLLVLFLMPVVLVLVVSLVQENVLQTTGQTEARVLFVDRDGDVLGKTIAQRLRESGSFEVVTQLPGQEVDENSARQAVTRGDFQFCILIPEGTTDSLRAHARKLAKESFSYGDERRKEAKESEDVKRGVLVYFDPTLRGAFRAAVVNALQRVTLAVEIEEQSKSFSELFPAHMERYITSAMGPFWAQSLGNNLPEVRFPGGTENLLEIREETAFSHEAVKMPSSVQQNVPAWTLFGMFFIVVPLSGALIRERQEGTMMRLLVMPGSYLTILGGKIIAYLAVCLVQFVLMLLVGFVVLPLLGTPVLEMGAHPEVILLIAVCCALAASGYGILLGTLTRSYEQASMFGAVSVVIAAALGGIMVPVYVMPETMQTLSAFSPLGWGLEAFLDVFVRGGDFRMVWPEMSRLLFFFCGCIGGAWFAFHRRGNCGG